MMDSRQIAVERFCAKVGYALRMARLHRGLTISELADKSGVSRKDIRNLERGENYSAGLRKIAEMFFALGCELEFAVGPVAASGIEAPSGVETGNTDSTEGESPAREAGDAQ